MPRQVEPDPRPAKREKANRETWEKIRAQFEGHTCASCGLGDQLELHHCVPRSQSGSDVVENLCPLCRSCHTKLEGHESGWERVAAAVRQYIWCRQSRLNYVRGKLGVEGFDRRYPMLPDAATGFNAGPSPFNNPEISVEGVVF